MENKIKVVGQIDLTKFEKKEKLVLKKKEPKPEIVYPQEEIHFFQDKNKKIVGRSSSGKIAIISFAFKGKWVKDGEDWLCDIISEEERKIVVMPISCTVSAGENFNESVKKLQELQESGFHKPFLTPPNSRLYYQSK